MYRLFKTYGMLTEYRSIFCSNSFIFPAFERPRTIRSIENFSLNLTTHHRRMRMLSVQSFQEQNVSVQKLIYTANAINLYVDLYRYIFKLTVTVKYIFIKLI